MNLRQQAVTTKCRGYIHAEPSRVFEKAVDFRALKKNNEVNEEFAIIKDNSIIVINHSLHPGHSCPRGGASD